MRLQAKITIQPHVKSKLTAEKLLPLTWDKPKKKATAPLVGKEEAKKRFEAMVRAKGS